MHASYTPTTSLPLSLNSLFRLLFLLLLPFSLSFSSSQLGKPPPLPSLPRLNSLSHLLLFLLLLLLFPPPPNYTPATHPAHPLFSNTLPPKNMKKYQIKSFVPQRENLRKFSLTGTLGKTPPSIRISPSFPPSLPSSLPSSFPLSLTHAPTGSQRALPTAAAAASSSPPKQPSPYYFHPLTGSAS